MTTTQSKTIKFDRKDELRKYDMYELKQTLSDSFLEEYFEPETICVEDENCDHNNWLEEGYVCKKGFKLTVIIEED